MYALAAESTVLNPTRTRSCALDSPANSEVTSTVADFQPPLCSSVPTVPLPATVVKAPSLTETCTLAWS